jgi:GDP-L-fucose synthase
MVHADLQLIQEGGINAEAAISITGQENLGGWHNGMVGSALCRRLQNDPVTLLTTTRQQLDLLNQQAVNVWLDQHKPDAIILAAAKVGGIKSNNDHPVDFLYENTMIACNVLHAAAEVGTEKVLFLGSSCIYPKFAEQPITEEALLTGALEPTNEAYALAKIVGVKLCEAYRRQNGHDFISAMPTNLYGINDNFNLDTSHVLPALLRKIHEAKINNASDVTLWGTGTPRREFLFVDDLADACVFVLQYYSDVLPLNLGVGDDVTITELAETIARVVGWQGAFIYDTSKPDGTPRKLLNVNRLNTLGWQAKTTLEEGIRQTYRWYLERERVLNAICK